MPSADAEFLAAALVGYQEKLKEINGRIADLRSQLGQRGSPATATTAAPSGAAKRTRRALSPAARERIAAAQRKRWAAVRKAKDTASKPPAAKPARAKKAARKKVARRKAAPPAAAAAATAPTPE